MIKKILLFAAIYISASTIFGQATEPDKNAEDIATLKKAAIELLRETSNDVGRMRSMENRISFNAELASLMWFQDEVEAKSMYSAAVGDFNQLLTQFDSQINFLESQDDDDVGGLFGGYGRSPVARKFRIAMAVRQQIAMSLAEHAPELAYNFFVDSANRVTNAEFRKEIDESDKHFQTQLVVKIAASKSAKAAEYGKDSLKSGLTINHIELLKTIYKNDPDQGIDFGAAIWSQLKSESSKSENLYFYNALLSFGEENLKASQKKPSKEPVYSRNDLRDIADRFGSALLENDDDEDGSTALGYVDDIEKYAPGRAAQIRSKFRKSANSATKRYGSNVVADAISITSSAGGVSYGSGNVNGSPRVESDDDKIAEAKARAEAKLAEDVKNLNKEMPKDERDKVIARAREIIANTTGREKKIIGLSMLAAQVAAFGDQELADEIMRDAERFVNPQPNNYRDFMLSWMLASGYAKSSPEKAFPILEDVILRANGTINAFVKVAEFVDVNQEMIADGEVQVGAFGGGMISSMTRSLGMADSTVDALAKADFTKLRALTNTFDRIEIRVLAKMMVLRAVLDDKKPQSMLEMMMGVDPDENVDAVPPRPPMQKRPN